MIGLLAEKIGKFGKGSTSFVRTLKYKTIMIGGGCAELRAATETRLQWDLPR